MPRLNLIVEAMAKCAFPSKECAIGRMIAEIGKLLFSLRSISVFPTFTFFYTEGRKAMSGKMRKKTRKYRPQCGNLPNFLPL